MSFRIEDRENNDSKLVLHNKVVIGEIYKEADGYYVFDFLLKTRNGGYYSQRFFEFVTSTLQELNKEWDYKVKTRMHA